MRPDRAAQIVAVVFAALTLAALATGCGVGSTGARAADPAPSSPLSAVEVEDDAVLLHGPCHQTLGAEVERDGDQIVLRDITADGPESADDCASVSRVEVDPAAGITRGMDVVAPEDRLRFVLVRDQYAQVEYCGLDTPRCVEFSTDPVPAECSEASLRYATIGMYQGVYPLEVLRCEGDWAVIELDVCGGPSGDEGRYCGVEDGWALYTKAGGAPYWQGTGFEKELFCPNPAEQFGTPGLPDWVCEV